MRYDISVYCISSAYLRSAIQDKEHQIGEGDIFKGLSDKETFKQIPEQSQQTRHMALW